MLETEQRDSFGRRFGATLLAGIPGIVALVSYIYLTTPPTAVPTGLTRPLLAAVSGINPLILLAVACLVGVFATPRTRLRSHLLNRVSTGERIWPQLRNEARLAIGVGLFGSIMIASLDILLAPFVGVDLPASVAGEARQGVFEVLSFAPVRFLYGGITEELLLRFGLMSALALVGWYVTGRPSDGPNAEVMWPAIVISAVLFGVGHLPALGQSVDLTPALIIRTVLLNAIAGILLGWLYWRRSLEAAMIAHTTFHVPLLILSLVQVMIF